MTKYTIADQTRVNSFPLGIAKVLAALGHPEAAVTDESEVWDFLPFCGKNAPGAEQLEFKQLAQEKLDSISALMGREVTDSDRIADLAAELEAK